MAKRTPPVPPGNRSPKNRGGAGEPEKQENSPTERENLKEQGRQGNVYQNTRNQGYQQDR